MTKNTDTPKRPRHRHVLLGTTLFLVGGLTLAGCAAGTTESDDSTSTSSVSRSATGGLTVTDAAGEVTESHSNTTAETIANITEAVAAFLDTLTEEQRETVTYEYDDETKTTSWSNFPVTFVERAGLNVADLTEVQQVAALQVLEALLSDDAYETASNIIASDQYLADYSSSSDADILGQYYIAFFGDVADVSAYEVQFGGHHLGINATLDGSADSITFAPTHLGVQPADWTTEDGVEVQAFGDIYTEAFAFYDSLTAEQQATLNAGDVTMCAPGDTCDFTTGAGLSGAELSEEQQQLLLDLIANWSGMADEETAATTRAEIEATLDATTIAWSGETTYDMTQGDGINFSISGPNVYVAVQAQEGSAGANIDGVTTSGWGHVHSIYRDPTNDYANSVEQQEATGGVGGGVGAPGDGGAPPSSN
ncbi:DUF3500 domain-containing protein [Frigoribacterium sp. ACAM 257]|uniref:DUF3500 domain-containing protein n=1 Tax=Frigoribacterium sp. ACAM 257 TaxID=2508998 RepID=UPI0011B9AF39|nr:DUF3500 domain-containing protein [Frigoribacterium sp. ACAM 257]TWX37397.1 DUF3500 domain-containing protein [Frigoribacterium sp. ACAM 257]